MEARKIAVKLRRDPRETAERHSQANPLTLECTLASGEAVTETMELRAELHAAQTPQTTPLAATAAVTMNIGETGPWELEFSGAQMNQTVLPNASEDFWLVVYATNVGDDLFTLGKIALTLTFDNISQTTPAPPDPALFLDLGGTKWKLSENYVVDDIVALDGSIYVCTADNTSSAGDEPGVGQEWESFWTLFSGGGGGSGDVTGPASSTDNAITRFNGTTGKSIQNSAATLDDNGGIAADTLAISTTPTGAGGTGIFRYDTGEKVPEVGIDGITLKIGVQEYVRVYNDTPSTMLKGAVVYISGAQGNRVAVKLADATDESTSAGTLGIVAQSITAAGEGFVQVSGPMYNLNTIGLTAGALLFLSETAGQWTQTEPAPPAHGVRLAYVERVSATVGSVYIKVDNGYELGELHNVNDTITGATAFLVKNSATNVWESKNASDSRTAMGAGTGNGTVTTVSVTTANGVSGSVANATTTPAIALTLGAITPTSVNGVAISGSSTPTLAVTGTASVSGTNTGNQTITLTGDVTGSGTGTFAATIASNAVTTAKLDAEAVTYAKIQSLAAASTLLGRGTAGGTLVREIAIGAGLTMSGNTLSATVFNPDSPGAIGGTTPSTGVFTQLDVRTELDVQSLTGAAGPLYMWNTGVDVPTNWERARLQWSSNVLVIGTQRNGTGVARAIDFQTGGTTRMTLGASGGLSFASGNSVTVNGSAGGRTATLSYSSVSGALNAANEGGYGSWLLQCNGATLVELSNQTTSRVIFSESVNMAFGTTTGTRVGTATNQRIGFWNATPAVQPAAVADATDAATAITQLNALLARLRTIGVIAT